MGSGVIATSPPFDFNHDGDVDGDDLAILNACFSGPGVGGLPAGCLSANFDTADSDNDNDVDGSDFGLFQRCFSGQGKSANPNCAN